MAVNVKDIETLWKQYSEEGVRRGISVAQFFESNGVPYRTFEKWYKNRQQLLRTGRPSIYQPAEELWWLQQ